MPEQGMSNQLSNVLGVAIPYDLKKQLDIRSKKLGNENRSSNDIQYLANKSCWVRLVSSVRIKDIQYFKRYFPDLDVNDGDSLAKKFVLFAGTSEYKKSQLNDNGFQYNIRSGFGANGSYGMLGNVETQLYGYKPMPGITDARIETQGKLGSIRSATINFKAWDKAQLDIIDALYFKLGYTMFLEWGHTTYFDNGDDDKYGISQLKRSDLKQIDPFAANLKKEIILREISTRIDESNGNYDAMLGMCTNFNFSMNEDGGYDCSIRMIALGELASQIKINQSSALPGILNSEIKELVDIYTNILREKARQERIAAEAAAAIEAAKNPSSQPIKKYGINETLMAADPTRYSGDKSIATELINDDSYVPRKYKTNSAVRAFYSKYPNFDNDTIKYAISFSIDKSDPKYLEFKKQQEEYKKANTADDQNSNKEFDQYGNVLYMYADSPPTGVSPLGKGLYSKTFGVFIPEDPINNSKFINNVTLDGELLKSAFYYFRVNSTNKGLTDSDGNNVFYLDRGLISTFSKRSLVATANFATRINNNSWQPLAIQYTVPDIGFNGDLLLYGLHSIINDFTKGDDRQIPVDKFAHFIYSKNYVSNYSDDQYGNISKLIKDRINTRDLGELTVRGAKNDQSSVFVVKGKSKMITNGTKNEPVANGTQVEEQQVATSNSRDIEWTLVFYDSSFIKDIQPASGQGYLIPERGDATTAPIANVNPEDQISLDASSIQAQEKLNYQSGLESFIRAIQLHSFNVGYKDLGVKDGKIGVIDLSNEKNDFLKNLFGNGIFSKDIKDLCNNTEKYKTEEYNKNAHSLMLKYASYGFNHNLMSQPEKTQKETIKNNKIPQVKFKDLCKSHVVPYTINQGIAKDIDINYPVYINFGFLLFALNHMCTIYDSETGKKVNREEQTPLIYIDFNPETNFCLSEPLQMSTDPLKILIPFRGTNDEYSKLFDPKLIQNGKIKPPSGSTESKDLFKPKPDDYLSSQLPEFKGTNKDVDAYSGKIMNILLSCDYILSLCKNFANNDQNQSVKLRPFLQQIIDDINKYLGGINLLRLAYDDKSNCLYIVDDQVQPMKLDEKSVPSSKINSEIPVFGKYSIARSLEIRTDISSKLSNMIAISANSDIKSDASKDGTPFGHYNDNYTDRFIPQVVSINTSTKNSTANSEVKDTEIAAASAFNEFVKCAFNTGQISDASTSAATNYYIDRMNKRKGENPGTESSAMIPISVNFSTDGISGLAMGHAFLLPKEVMPASYERRSNSENLIGFVVTGLNHVLQNNMWTTEVKANMMYLKDAKSFVAQEGSYNIAELSTGNFVIVQNDGNDTDIINVEAVGGSGVKGEDFKVNPTYKNIVAAAKASVGTSTAAIPGTENGNIGCGAGTSIIFLRATGKGIVPPGDLCLGTSAISSHLGKDASNWRQRSNWTEAKPGDIIVTERGSGPGHIGVVVDTLGSDGSYTIISNSSGGFRGTNKGTIQPNYTLKKWASVASRNPSRTFAYEYIGSFS